MTSSSMDFVDEYGFDHYDGAKNLWNEAVALRFNYEYRKSYKYDV